MVHISGHDILSPISGNFVFILNFIFNNFNHVIIYFLSNVNLKKLKCLIYIQCITPPKPDLTVY